MILFLQAPATANHFSDAGNWLLVALYLGVFLVLVLYAAAPSISDAVKRSAEAERRRAAKLSPDEEFRRKRFLERRSN